MNRNFKNVSKLFFGCIILAALIFSGSCQNWMNDDGFKDKIETEVHDANAAPVSVYVRYANSKMGTTEPQGNITMKVDVETELTAVTSDDYGFVKWAAFSTTDFSSSKQHSSLIYESDAHYEQNYKPLELSSSEIFFSNPTDPVTKVKIYKERNDIFIIPIVAKRPTIVTSVPTNGRSDVVRNSSIRILFSKPIEESSLKDSEGNSNIVVTSGSAVLTENSDDMGAKEITDYFNIKLSATKKMLTLSLKQGIYMDNNSQINVNIYEDVCDTDGFTMNGKYTFTFTTGTKLDSLAPRIDELSAGIGDDCLAFEQYKYIKKGSNETVPNYTDEAEKATNNIDTFVTGDAALVQASKKPILKQRVKDYINIYVQATDIAGAGRNVDDTNTNNLSESDVALIQVRATLYVDKDGAAKTTSKLAFANNSTVSQEYYKGVKEIGYAMGLKDSSCKIQKKFEDILPDANGGTIFTYDLSDMPDGLIKIDVWAIDMVGNSGETEEYVAEYNNGYRSIFVVKDSSAPSAENAISKININAEDAPYKWYNRNSLSQIQIKEKDNSSITDLNDCAALRSDFNDLKWAFKLGKDLAWQPSPTDTTIWTPIHTNNVSNIRTLANAAASADGAIDITMCLMDDLGNISKPVIVESINYDNTAPVISSSVASKVNWVKKSADVYTETVAVTDSNLLSSSGHILKIPFTENGAGIRRVKVTVTKEGTTQTINQGNYTITYVPDSGESRELTYTDLASDNTIKELNSSDTSKVNSGTLYISKIQIGEQTGSYKVRVDIWDSALNTTYTETTITIDKTNPVINKLYIPDLKKSISAGADGLSTESQDGWFLPKKWVASSAAASSLLQNYPGFIPLYIFIKEQDSGISQIVFDSEDVCLYNNEISTAPHAHGKTKIYKIEKYGQPDVSRDLIPETDYNLNLQTKTITFNNDKCLKSQNEEFVILIENIGFSEIKANNNIINVKVYDLATREDQEDKISPYTDKNVVIDGVKADSYLLNINNYTLTDRQGPSGTLPAAPGYTNENIIDLTVVFDDDSKTSASSGYNSFHISGATFTNNTQVKIGDTAIDYEMTENNTVITLRNKVNNAFTDDYIVIRSKTVTFTNISFADSEGQKTISITTSDLAGNEVGAKALSITYDKTSPSITKLPFVTDYSGSPEYYKPQYNVYPHEGASNDTGVLINGVPTFYTATTHRSGATQTNGVLANITNSQYGVVLGVTASDTYALYSNSGDQFIRYYKHAANDTNVTKETVIQNGVYANTDLGNTAANGTLRTGFDVGKYSAIVVDSAGNTSDVFHFNVVQDVTEPADFDMNLVTIEKPENTGIYRYDTYSNESLNDFEFDFRDSTNSEGNTSGMWVYKYVIKKTGTTDKYKLVIKLNGTQTGDELLTGSTVSAQSSYNETFGATANSSPIEQYAISTWYGAWQTSNQGTSADGHQYHAAVPMNTVLPNGIQLTADNYSTTSSQLLGYFGYTYHSSFIYKNSSWIAPTGKTSWHDYNSGTSNTDSGNGITSYIDSSNNLVIEIPNSNTKYLPPITVFLRDGCGNMKSLLLKPNDSFAICFVTDGMLGYQTTDDNGQVTSPIVIQNPFMDPAGTGMTWDGQTYSWNEQSGNYDKTADNGVGEKRGFIKDFVKNQTYYNDAYTNFKLALTLRFGTTSGNQDSQETALFSSAGKTTSTTDYTCRAVLYTTTNANEVPDYSTITAGKADTDWTYAQADSSSSEIRILLDYPKPSYNTPFYIWYLIEDRLGNYEIAKVVNSAASGNALRANTNGMFDKWVYDNEGPVLKTRQSGLNPAEVDDINELIGSNNGFTPYAVTNGTTKTVYVHASKTHQSVQAGETLNNTLGTGTTNLVDGHPQNGEPYSIYNSFADLAVSESTGIRAFAWTTSPNAPFIDDEYHSYWDSSEWYATVNSFWYVGWLEVDNMRKDIGVDHDYKGKTENAYYSGDYSGKYSGTKLCTVFPYGKLDTSTPTPLYIHLIDWTGNISSYRIGKDIEFVNDSTVPGYTSSSVTGVTVADQYYISKDSGEVPVVRIAGKGAAAKNHEPINVYIPEDCFEESGSGIKGFTLTETGINSAQEYLSIPYDTYHKNNENEYDLTYYVYDNAGNRAQKSLKFVFDETAPSISSVSLVTSQGSDTIMVNSSGPITTAVDGYGKVYNCTLPAEYHSKASEILASELMTVYLNKSQYTKFHVNLVNDPGDVQEVIINKWAVTGGNGVWTSICSYNKPTNDYTGITWSGNMTTEYHMGSGPSSGYGALSFDANGTYYQICVTDISGNTSCQYFRLFLDNEAPVFTEKPTLTVKKGSVNKIGSTTNYAYTSDSNNKAKLTINVSDAGVGIVYNHFDYKVNSGEWVEFTGNSIDYEFSGIDVTKISIRDIFGRTSEVITESTGFQYKKDNTTIADDISKLVYYNTTPSAPAFDSTHIEFATKSASQSSNYTVQNFDSSTTTGTPNYIIIKESNPSRPRAFLKLSFKNKPNTILGYMDSVPSTATGVYSLTDTTNPNSPVKTEFEYTLPMATDKSDVSKDYYAIDYAGNVSAKITIIYTYNNPHQAQNIEFIPSGSDQISSDLSSSLTADGVTLAPSVISQNGTTLYYGSGYVLVRCTILNNNPNYVDNPVSLNLFAGNSDTSAGTFEYGNNGTLKRYLLGEATGNRYYCYLAFPISAAQSNKALYCTIGGGESTSQKVRLAASDVTWVQDVSGPVLDSSMYRTDSGNTGVYPGTNTKIKKVNGYTAKKSDGTAINSFGEVKDSQIGEGYSTNLYSNGTQIFIPVNKITDSVGLAGYQIVTVVETAAQSGDASFTAQPTSTWNDMVTQDGNYKFILPNITAPHTHIALFFKDIWGNVSEGYYLGNTGDDYYKQWWILEQTLSESNISITRNNNTLSVTIPVGMVVTSVTAQNAEIDSVSFNDYTQGQPGLSNLSSGWINISGLTVVLKNIAQPDWQDKPVKLLINGVSKTAFTVLARTTFNEDEISITCSPSSWSAQNSEYTVTISIPSGAPASLINVTQAENATFTWDSSNPTTVTLTGITQTNAPQTVNLIINGFTKKVFDVAAAAGGNGGNGGNGVNASIRGAGLAMLQGLVAGGSSNTVETTQRRSGSSIARIGSYSNYVPPVEVQEIVTLPKIEPVTEAIPKQTSKKKSKAKVSAKTKASDKAVVEKVAAQVQEVLPDAAPIEAVTSAPEAVTSVSSVTSIDSVVEPHSALSGTTEDIISVTQPEKSSSKTALIVVMLALLSAAAGAWYLQKSRK